jgi:hypothetical protein
MIDMAEAGRRTCNADPLIQNGCQDGENIFFTNVIQNIPRNQTETPDATQLQTADSD